MRCPNCQKENGPADLYCTGCGTKLLALPPVPKKNPAIKIVGFAAVLLLAAGVGLGLFLWKGQETPAGTSSRKVVLPASETTMDEDTTASSNEESWKYAACDTDYKVVTSTTIGSAPGTAQSKAEIDKVYHISQTAQKGEEIWGECTDGWIQISDGQRAAMEEVVLRDSSLFTADTYQMTGDTLLYASPSQTARSSGKLYASEKVKLSGEKSDAFGTVWGQCDSGWFILKTPMKSNVQEYVEVHEETIPAEKQTEVKTEVIYVPVETPSSNTTQSYTPTPYYILPTSNTQYLSRSDISWMSRETLELARNEIYARRGRMFQTDYIQQYFDDQIWYVSRYSPEAFDESVFNACERANIALIVDYEIEKGWR